MKKIWSIIVPTILLFSTNNAFGAFDSNGGFSGPSSAAVSVEKAKKMWDDSVVTLRGNIIHHFGGEHYLFKDNSGEITIEIDQHHWNGNHVTPNDIVEIQGEVDKDWNSVKIDVDYLQKIQ